MIKNLKNIKQKSQKIFKTFFYKTFLLFHGKIKGKINFTNNSKMKIEIVEKQNNIKYKIYKIKDGRLYTDRIHDTAIILDNFIVEGPSFQFRTINFVNIINDKVEKNIVFQRGTPRIKRNLNGKVLSLLTGGAGNDNYWHWLFDVLPRFALCEKVLDLNDIDFFLLPSIDKKFQKETLDLLNISKKKRLSSKSFRHINASELFVTEHPYVITNDVGYDIQNIPIWISKWLKEKYINSKSTNNLNLPKKIFIDSSDSSQRIKKLRLLVNEYQVRSFLINKGFESIILGNLHFRDQIKIFNNAEIIIGLHGAGFANMCFCKPGTKIIEIKSNKTKKVIENLAKTNDLFYKSISCEPTKFVSENSFGHINVSINLLKKVIED